MSGRDVDVGGEGPILNIYVLNLKVIFFYWSRRVVSLTLRSGVRKHGRALERMVLCIVLAVGPLPLYVHLAST